MTPNYIRFAPTRDPNETAARFMAWAHYYFGDKSQPKNYLLYKKTASMHMLIAAAFAKKLLRTLITAPRGYAKTTWCRLWVIYCCCYGSERFILFVSKPGQGASNGRFVRNQLATNAKLHRDYGNLLPETTKAKRDTAKTKDNDEILTLTNGVLIAFNTIEGNVHGSSDLFRPTLIVCEDLQGTKHVKEAATMETHWDMFQSDIMFALDKTYGKILVIGNNYGKGSIVGNIIDEVAKEVESKLLPSWNIINIDIYDEKGNSSWEDMFSTTGLKSDQELYRFHNKSKIFDAQRRNIPDDSEKKAIKGYLYHNCRVELINQETFLISDDYPHPLRCNIVAAVDPAFSMVTSSDRRAKVVFAKAKFPVAKGRYVNGVFVIEYEYDHSNPAKIPEWILSMHRKYKLSNMVIEANGGQIIFQYLNDEKFVNDDYYHKHPFQATYIKYVSESKGDRIWNSMDLLCKYGQFFIKHGMGEITEECDNFGYNIKRRAIHLLDAITFGNANAFTPEVETMPLDIRMAIPRCIGAIVPKLTSRQALMAKLGGRRSILLM